jgi:hypothetical protein
METGVPGEKKNVTQSRKGAKKTKKINHRDTETLRRQRRRV